MQRKTIEYRRTRTNWAELVRQLDNAIVEVRQLADALAFANAAERAEAQLHR